jgi:hypothetical protein
MLMENKIIEFKSYFGGAHGCASGRAMRFIFFEPVGFDSAQPPNSKKDAASIPHPMPTRSMTLKTHNLD